MKITSGKKEEILKRKREYDARMNLYDADRRDREVRYHNAQDDVLEPIQEEIMRLLSKYNLLEFEVSARPDTAYGDNYRDRKTYIRVEINCNDRSKRDHALSWHIYIKMDHEGNVVKESGSWSGLEATSMENIEELKQTVSALEEINTMDWAPITTRTLPKWEDYYEGAMERPETQNFDAELREAELEELIGQNKAIKIYGWGESYTGRYYYAKMLGQSASQWKLIPIPSYYMDYALAGDEAAERHKQLVKDYNYDVRARKSSIRPVKDDNGNYTIIDLDTFQEV